MDELDSLFAEASVVGTENTDIEWLEISHDFRTIDIPKTKQLAGVTSDDKVNRIYFKCPRYCSDVDLGDFSFRINYTNANTEGDQYIVTDKEVSDSEITFTWLVGRHACEYPGSISFVVCAVQTDDQATIQKEYNTAIHKLQVVQGLETTEEIYEEVSDIVAQMQNELDNLDGTVEELVNARMQEIIDMIDSHTAILG